MIIGAVLNSLVNFMFMGETLPNAIAMPRVIGRNAPTNLVDLQVNGTRFKEGLELSALFSGKGGGHARFSLLF